MRFPFFNVFPIAPDFKLFKNMFLLFPKTYVQRFCFRLFLARTRSLKRITRRISKMHRRLQSLDFPFFHARYVFVVLCFETVFVRVFFNKKKCTDSFNPSTFPFFMSVQADGALPSNSAQQDQKRQKRATSKQKT